MTSKLIAEDYVVTFNNTRITITSIPNDEDKKRAEAYKKQYGYPSRNSSFGRTHLSAGVTGLSGTCSGKLISLLSIPSSYKNKSASITEKAELVKMMMARFSTFAILVYICRSSNATISKVLTKAGWKKSRGPTGKYSPWDYTLDVYTVDPRLPKKKLPLIRKKKRVVSKQQPMITEKEYFGLSFDNIKRRIGELRG